MYFEMFYACRCSFFKNYFLCSSRCFSVLRQVTAKSVSLYYVADPAKPWVKLPGAPGVADCDVTPMYITRKTDPPDVMLLASHRGEKGGKVSRRGGFFCSGTESVRPSFRIGAGCTADNF